MNLGEWPPQTDGTVVRVDVDPTAVLRLRELGLRPGGTVRVTHRAAFGGRVVGIGADRFAVDAATCARIEVAAVGAGAGAAR
jgi:ferrous iron transport protein A